MACMGPDMKAPEGKQTNVFCQKSKANCEDQCAGVWHTNMKAVAGDSLEKEKIFPAISGLGEVVGYTRSDKDVLLLPFSLPRGVRVGVDDDGESVLREILLTMDDAGREKVFKVAKRSLAYDRREASSCGAPESAMTRGQCVGGGAADACNATISAPHSSGTSRTSAALRQEF